MQVRSVRAEHDLTCCPYCGGSLVELAPYEGALGDGMGVEDNEGVTVLSRPLPAPQMRAGTDERARP